MIRKLLVGRDQRFYWLAPGPVTGNPSLTIKLPAGDHTPSPDLAVVKTTASVIAIAEDGQRIQVSESISDELAGLIGTGYGAAHLKLGSLGTFPVIISQAHGPVLHLARRLPALCTSSGLPTDAAIEWALYSAVINSAQLPDPVQSAEWSVQWTRADGADVPSAIQVDSGELRVVRRIFTTGLKAHNIGAYLPSLLGLPLPNGQMSWQPQIDAALMMMVPIIEARIRRMKPGAVIDDAKGDAFAYAHALFVGALLLKDRAVSVTVDQGEANKALGEAHAELGRVLNGPLWLDIDGDGQADSGETVDDSPPTAVSGAFSDSATFGPSGTYERFRIGDDR